MALVGAFASIGAAVFMIDQANCIDGMDLFCKLDVFQYHLIIVDSPCQGDYVEIIIAKTDRDPWLEEFLQPIIHAMDNKSITVNDRLIFS